MSVNKVVTNKITLLVDDAWLHEILTKMIPYVEDGEILQILDNVEVQVCEDCQRYLTAGSEVVMDVFRCPNQQEFCLNCCGCPEHDITEGLFYV